MDEQATRLEALDELLHVAVELKRHVEDVGARHGLTGPQVRLIIALDRPLRMQEAAEATACEPSHLTAVAEQLERAGLLVREQDPADRRVRNLTPTPLGVRRRGELLPAVLADAPVISRLDRVSCARLRELLAAGAAPDA